MTEIRFTSEINIPYDRESKDPALFDPTEKEAPDGINNLLTSQDLKDLVKAPTIDEVVQRGGKNRVIDELNQTLVRAFGNRVKNLDSYRQQLLTVDEVKIAASEKEIQQYTKRLVQSRFGKEAFAQYLAKVKTAEPFAAQILNQLAQQNEGAILSGWLFAQIQNPEIQKNILLQMDNIAAASRMLLWTETAFQRKGADPGIYNKRCTEWAASSPKLALICATKEGMAIDSEQIFSNPMDAAIRQDRALAWLVQYYETKNYGALVEGLETLKKENSIKDFYITPPNQNGDIEMVEIYFSIEEHPAKNSEIFLLNKTSEQTLPGFLRQEEQTNSKGNLVVRSFFNDGGIRWQIFDRAGRLIEFGYPPYKNMGDYDEMVTQIEYDSDGKEWRRRTWVGSLLESESTTIYDTARPSK